MEGGEFMSMMQSVERFLRSNGREVKVFLLFFVVYCSSITLNYSLSHDSTYYLNEIEYLPWIFHPHHLLFHVVAKVCVMFFNAMPFLEGLDVAYKVGSMNAVFGSLTLATLAHYSYRKLGLTLYASNAMLALVGFSFSYWYYSGCAEVYIIPLFFVVRSIISLHAYSEGTGTLNRVVIWLSLATLFHQANIILFGMLLLYVALHHRNDLVKGVVRGLGISFLIIGLPYLFAGCVYYGHTTFQGYRHWLFMYSDDLPEYWTPLGPKMIVTDFIGFARTFYSTFFLYSIESIRAMVLNIFRNQWLGEEVFLVRNMSPIEGFSLLFAAIASGLLLLLIVISNLRNVRYRWLRHKSIVVILGFYTLTYSIFFTFWSSTNPEFWIPQNLFFWVLVVLLFVDTSQRRNRLAITGVASCLLLVNFFGGIVYTKTKANDLYYQRLHGILQNHGSSAPVLALNSGVLKDYLIRYKFQNYFCIEESFRKTTTDSASLAQALDSLISHSPSHTVFATSELCNPEPFKYPSKLTSYVRSFTGNKRYQLLTRNIGADDMYYEIQLRETPAGRDASSPVH